MAITTTISGYWRRFNDDNLELNRRLSESVTVTEGGGNRMIVKCLDGKERNCRIPGGRRRRLWIRPGDTLIVQPWEHEGDKKADIFLKYTPAQVNWLKKKGFIKEIESEF